MKDTIKSLRKKLEALKEQIKETEARLPAHSVKPPIMHELFALEDERDRVLELLRDHPGQAPPSIRKTEKKLPE